MKQFILISAVFALLLFVTPLTFNAFYEGKDGNSEKSPETAPKIGKNSGKTYNFPKTLTLKFSESGETAELSVKEYLIGCMFAQIPLNYHQTALNAQAAAAHTYLQRLMLDKVEISDDATVCQPYFTEEKAKQHYKDEYDVMYKKAEIAAEYGAKRVIMYEGEPIYSVYHSISAGMTNTALSVWGRDFPYLRSVESSWDAEHPNFTSINEIDAKSIRLDIFGYNRTASMPVDYSKWFVNPVNNDYGYVASVRVGETLLSGGDVWRIFNLRSTAFDISFRSGEVFVAETRGFGHGVGLSQYGADRLGERKFTCEAVLKHYYTGVEIVEIEVDNNGK